MNSQPTDRNTPFSLRQLPTAFWIIVSASTSLALLLILFMVAQGYRDGLQRGERHRRQQVAILLQQAADLLQDGQAAHALAAYAHALEIDPENTAARAALIALHALPTPVSTPIATATPNPLEIVRTQAVALYAAGSWQDTIDRIAQLQATQPDFRQQELEELLFDAYVALARAKAAHAESLEAAVQLYDKALELQPDDPQIQEERVMLALYLDVQTNWFADWPKVIALLEDLYRRDPNYRNVQYRLQRAHVQYGDSFARAEEWCMAAAQYTSAIAVLPWQDLITELEQLADQCEQAQSNPEEDVYRPQGSGASVSVAVVGRGPACPA